MSGIVLGNSSIRAFKFGSSDVKVYLGNIKLWPTTQEPCFEVVDAISAATGNYVDVYNTSDSKWYKKNNLSQYEEYGVMPTVDELSATTYYTGKLVILSTDNHEYKWNGSSWTDLGNAVISIKEYFLAENDSDSRHRAYIHPGYYWGEGYHMVIDVYFTTWKGMTVISPNNTLSGTTNSPIEFCTYADGFYNDFHRPSSSSNNSCYTGDYTQRNITASTGISPLQGRRFKIKVGIVDVTWYDYDGTQLYSGGTVYSGYNWYNGLYFAELRSSKEYTFRLKGFKVYDSNDNLVNDIEFRKREGASADKILYAHDNVLDVDYENDTNNPIGYYESESGSSESLPEEYQTKVPPPNNVVYSTLAELELMECPWIGMRATVGGESYIYTANGWEVDETPYTQYEYVQGNGNSYIVTDYIPNSNTRYEIDIQGRIASSPYVKEGESHFFGGCDIVNGSATNRFKILYPGVGDLGVGGIRFDYADKLVHSRDSRIITRGVLRIDSSGGYFNDQRIVTFDNHASISDSHCHCGIFCNRQYDASSGQETNISNAFYTGRIYSVKIYENDVLVRNYVPAEKNGVCGFYETVTGTMLGSFTSTPFTVG